MPYRAAPRSAGNCSKDTIFGLACHVLTFMPVVPKRWLKKQPFWLCVNDGREQTRSQSTAFASSDFGATSQQKRHNCFQLQFTKPPFFSLDMVMADIAIDGCVGSYWVLGLQDLLLNWRDGYNLTFVFAICGRQTKTWLFQLWNHMMSHVITVHPSHTFNDVLSTVSWKQQMWFLDIWLKCCQKGRGLPVQVVNSTWSRSSMLVYSVLLGKERVEH